VTGRDDKRRSVRLGKVDEGRAETLRRRITDLEQAALYGDQMTGETRRWLVDLDGLLRDRLAAVGLVAARERLTLGKLLEEYIERRTDAKLATVAVWGHTKRNLISFFGEDRHIRLVTSNDAEDWRRDLVNQNLSDNTVRRRSGIAKQFFHYAVKRGYIAVNPFVELVSAVHGNADRQFFVTRATTVKVLQGCPDAEWRLIVGLCRFAGLRCTSEVLGLRWADVDWANEWFTVHSPKTERHAGKATRRVPIFPDLAPLLREVFEAAEPGAEYVITRYRRSGVNLGTHFRRIIVRAGVEPWPKLFQNLRSSCETELVDKWPAHVACAWIGHSEKVALKHYLQVTDEHFKKAVQNAVQTGRELSGQELHGGEDEKNMLTQTVADATVSDMMQNLTYQYDVSKTGSMVRGGLEPPTPAFSVRCSTN